MATTSVSLTDHHKQLIEQQIASGRYASTADVIREGLRLVEDRELKREVALAELDRLVEAADASGAPMPFDEAAIESIKARGRERLNASSAERRAA